MPRRPLTALVLVPLLLAASAGAGSGAAPSAGSGRAFAVRIVLPGQAATGTQEVVAPPDAVQFVGGFAYPADGSILTTGAVNANAAAAAAAASASGSASSQVASVTLFRGEITVTSLAASARASAASGKATGDLARSAVTGLTVLGQAVEASPGLRVPLGDWGYAITLAQGVTAAADAYRGFVTALEITLTAEHGGLPAGSIVSLGYAEAAAKAAPPPPPTTTRRATTTTTAPTTTRPEPEPERTRPPPEVRTPPPGVAPRLTEGGYVFPVYGLASFSNTFGAPRAVVGWHHGEDIFAPLGAPVLAVARGTVYSVGWNDLGGNRLWVRDTEGNEFYYAHLSAFSPLAVDGAHVEAGDVLGFVGNTGDAEVTPPHLHFEIHPVGLLSLGYDGVVEPYRFLLAWRRLEDVRFIAGAGWVPSLAQPSNAPTPGAFLLSSSDISSASGLEPGALQRALAEETSSEQP